MDHLTRPTILKLNSNWMPIGFTTARKTIPDIVNGAVQGLDITYNIGADGEYDYDNPEYIVPVAGWDKWVALPIREYDDVITTPKCDVRFPTVVVCSSFSQMPMVRPKLTKRAVMERDGFKCCYTGEQFSPSDAHLHLNIDHVIPRAQGGQTQWENVVTCSKKINTIKDARTPEQAGLKLRTKPVKPGSKPLASGLYSSDKVADNHRWILKPSDV